MCIVDVHNYARFNGVLIGQGGPPNEVLANLWSQLATHYASESRIIFGVMDEPHDIPNIVCKLCSVGELHERLDCKSMEIKWYIYMKVDP